MWHDFPNKSLEFISIEVRPLKPNPSMVKLGLGHLVSLILALIAFLEICDF